MNKERRRLLWIAGTYPSDFEESLSQKTLLMAFANLNVICTSVFRNLIFKIYDRRK
jgi:hypothetical protein